MSRYFAFCRIELGLSKAEVDAMHETEIQEYIKAWEQKEERQNYRAAGLIAALGNCIYGASGIKSKLKASDYLSKPRKNKPVSSTELFNQAVAAFGAPAHIAKRRAPKP